MGDLIMSSPAIKALKETFNAKITLLTSSMGKLITPFIPVIDDVIVADLPWVKTNVPATNISAVAQQLRQYQFDAAVIFTVYSQSALPSALLAYEAGIPLRLAYARENPYDLITDWIPDKEPYSYILHQVERDLQLVASVGAFSEDDRLLISYHTQTKNQLLHKLAARGVDMNKPWINLHPGVSEKKREYPTALWAETAQKIAEEKDMQILFTGSAHEYPLVQEIKNQLPGNAVYNLAGALSIEEFICLIDLSPVIVSVNTGTIHIAAALQTPAVVLYAQTNPQHTPWKSPAKLLYYSVCDEMSSKNEIIQYVSQQYFSHKSYPQPDEIYTAVQDLLAQNHKAFFKADYSADSLSVQ